MAGKRFLLVLLFFCVLVQAVVDDNITADGLYKKAIESIRQQDYVNALAYAEGALDAYSKANDTAGVKKCDELMKYGRINLTDRTPEVQNQTDRINASLTEGNVVASTTTTSPSTTMMTNVSTLAETSSQQQASSPSGNQILLVAAAVVVLSVVGLLFLKRGKK